MLSAPFAYAIALIVLALCGLIALTFVKVVNRFDGTDQQTKANSDVHHPNAA